MRFKEKISSLRNKWEGVSVFMVEGPHMQKKWGRKDLTLKLKEAHSDRNTVSWRE